jgi:hypothetical protein
MNIKARVTEQGLLIPRYLLAGFDEVEIRQEQNRILIVPIMADPILQLGQQPVSGNVTDASEHHDDYIYNQ